MKKNKMDNYNNHELNKEIKIVKIKKYKTLLNLVYRIFGGIILKKHLKDICIKYSKYTEGTFNAFIDELEELKLIDIIYISASDCSIIKLKQFVIDEIEGKRSRGISYSDSRLIMSCFKYYYIVNNPNLNNISKNINLDSLYERLLNDTSFWNKENSATELYEWILDRDIYSVKNSFSSYLKLARKVEEIRNNRISKDKDASNETVDTKKLDYTDKVNFGSLRNKNMFISSFENDEEVLELNAFLIIEDSPDVNYISSLIHDSIYLSINHLSSVRKLNINLHFRDVDHLKSSFNSCVVKNVDSQNIKTEKCILTKRIDKLSKKYIKVGFYPYKTNIDESNYLIKLKYRFEYAMSYVDGDQNNEDKKILVNINFVPNDLYNDLYGKNKTEQMKEVAKVNKEKKQLEKASREEAIKFITKVADEGNLDTLLELSRLSKTRIKKLKTLLDEM